MSELNFDARTVAPDTGTGDPLPAGWYNVMVDESELKPTSDGTGARLAVRFTVIDGQYVGRKLFEGFNLKNSNPTAVEIAFKQLSALAHAVGVLDVKTSEMLHGIPLLVKVKVKPAKGDYEAGNGISAYKSISAGTGSTGPAPAGFAPPASAPQGFAPPPAPVAPVASGPKMTATAQASYADYINAGWNDQQLIQGGFMEAPVQAVAPPPAPVVAQPGPPAPAWNAGATAPPAQPWANAPPSTPPSAPPAPLAPPAPQEVAQVATPPWQQ